MDDGRSERVTLAESPNLFPRQHDEPCFLVTGIFMFHSGHLPARGVVITERRVESHISWVFYAELVTVISSSQP